MSEQPQTPHEPTPPQRYGYDRYEKEEKQEKDQEKRDDRREKEEKNYEEKWRRDPVSAVGWAVFLVWIGLVFLASNLEWILIAPPLELWHLIVGGAGVILLGEVVFRLLMPTYRRPVIGTLIAGLVLLAVGIGGVWDWDLVWPAILIILGVTLLVRGVFRRR